MEAKKKALDLLMKFENITCPNGEQGRNEMTKRCALIHVDEMLTEYYHLSERYSYWLEVKQEILNL